MEVKVEEASVNSWLADFGLRLSNWFERWFPDAFALALVAVVVVYAASVGSATLLFKQRNGLAPVFGI